MRLFFYTIFYVSLILSTSSYAQTEDTLVLTEEYFPLSENLELIYNSTGGELTATIERHEKGFKILYDSDLISYEQVLIPDTNGIYIFEIINSTLFSSNSIFYNHPCLRIPFGVTIGDTWEWNGLEFYNLEPIELTLQGKVSGIETISTQAGQFDCIVVETIITEGTGDINRTKEWFAKGIGIVRAEAKIDGSGVAGLVQDLLGLDEIIFELVEIDK